MKRAKKEKAVKFLRRSSMFSLAAVFLFAVTLPSFIFTGKVEAAGEKYAFYFPNDDAVIRDINQKLGEDDPPSAATRTSAYAKGGFWGRLDGKLSTIPYNSDVSAKANDEGGGALGDDIFDVEQNGGDDDQYVFTTDYLCYGNGNKLEPDQSKGSALTQSFYYVSVAVVVELSDDGSFQNDTPFKTSVFPVFIKKFEQFTQADIRNGEDREYDLYNLDDYERLDVPYGDSIDYQRESSKHEEGDNNLTTAVDNIVNASGINKGKCLPPIYTDYQVKTDNYRKNKDKWKEIEDAIKEDGAPGAGLAPSDEALSDCDTKLLNPLSWILCPVIDIGANGSDYIFQNIIEPLLSDIPLSTDPNDDFFKAWQGFRFIANIILVGGMLGIVYSMARGDK